MKRRTYEYYALVKNLGKDTEEFISHAEQADTLKSDVFNSILKPGDSLHLVRLTNIVKWEKL